MRLGRLRDGALRGATALVDAELFRVADFELRTDARFRDAVSLRLAPFRAPAFRAAVFRLPPLRAVDLRAVFFAVFLVLRAPPRLALPADDLDRLPPAAFRLPAPVLRFAIAVSFLAYLDSFR